MTPTCRDLKTTFLPIFFFVQMLLLVMSPGNELFAATIDVSDIAQLRQAVDIVNTSTADTTYTIRMAAGTYPLTGADGENSNQTGDLDIAPSGTVSSVTFESSGGVVILDGSGLVRIMELFPRLDSSLTITLNNLTFQNGSTSLLGAALFVNGGSPGTEIYVNCNSVIFSGNTASESGGAIAAGQDTILTVADSTLQGNSTGYNGGALFCFGCSATISNTLFAGNSATPPVSGIGGGALFNCGGTVSVDQSSVIQENATEPITSGDWYGGALANSGIGAMTVNSPISHSLNSGSGIFNQGGTMDITLEERNPTLPGDLVVLSGDVFFDIQGVFNIAGTLYDPEGNLDILRHFAMPWLLLLLGNAPL